MVRKLSRTSLLLLALLFSSGFSWDWDTHEYAARQICEYIGCGGCIDELINGSVAPDKYFHDSVNHHCYDALLDCPAGNWTCPDSFDCPALEKSSYWLEKAQGDEGCEKFYDIGVASHYYLDSKVFWHRVAGEDYEECHAKFEGSIGDRIGSDFSITSCGITVTDSELSQHIADFNGMLGKKTDYTPLAIMAIVAILAIALRFRK